jgi:hypothetical protein
MRLVILALVTLGGFFGSFLGAYFKKKGENLATHEDIDKLVVQVRAVTTATKEIETKISSDVWDRQKRWELKRDLLFETAKAIAVVRIALVRLSVVFEADKDSKMKGGTERPDERTKAGTEWNEAAAVLDQSALLLDLACGAELRRTLLDFRVFARGLAGEAHEGRPEAISTSMDEFSTKLDRLSDLMRKEIGVENPG